MLVWNWPFFDSVVLHPCIVNWLNSRCWLCWSPMLPTYVICHIIKMGLQVINPSSLTQSCTHLLRRLQIEHKSLPSTTQIAAATTCWYSPLRYLTLFKRTSTHMHTLALNRLTSNTLTFKVLIQQSYTFSLQGCEQQGINLLHLRFNIQKYSP